MIQNGNKMKTRILGKTGLSVSELGLGSAFMAGQGQDGANRCVDYAVDHGVNYFDTAANYGDGRDETMLGAALKGKRDKVILATKVGFTNRERYRLDGHRNADQLMEQFESSLKRLQTDYVDIIQIHEADYLKWWTDAIPDDEDTIDWGALIEDDTGYDFANAPAVEFLANAKRSGKARFIGLTAKNARLLARILKVIDVDSVMTAHQFNPVFRNAVEFLFPTAQDLRSRRCDWCTADEGLACRAPRCMAGKPSRLDGRDFQGILFQVSRYLCKCWYSHGRTLYPVDAFRAKATVHRRWFQ